MENVSEITAAEYSRYLVAKEARAAARDRKQHHEHERLLRQEMQRMYQSRGRMNQHELSEQFARAKAAHREAALVHATRSLGQSRIPFSTCGHL